MSNDEIKKGLKCCTISYFRTGCKNCPYLQANKCNDRLCEDSLNLINEQEEEIERLKAEIKQSKIEAVKDFAEKVKKKYGKSCSEYYPMLIEMTSHDIDELLKEIEK